MTSQLTRRARKTDERGAIQTPPSREQRGVETNDGLDDGHLSIVIDLTGLAEKAVSDRQYPPILKPNQGLLGADPLRRFVKRCIDMLAAGTLLLLLGPFMALIALAVRLTSDGPAFFLQERVGRNGEIFEMFKFRTMYKDADRRLSELQARNEQNGPVFKIRRDPRITPLGRHLRRWSLDELPQLFNVLEGAMSLVGPRPPLPDEVRNYRDWEAQRLLVKPGLTCIWQVNGRSEIDFETWVQMDIEYIANWSLTTDFKLMAKTLPAVVRGEGAY